MDPMDLADLADPATAYRLVCALAAAGLVLLALEIFLPGMAPAPFGAVTLLGAIGIAYYGCGIDVGSILLLIVTTVVSLGFLVTVAWFPQTPLARRVLRRAAQKAAAEAAQSEDEPPGSGAA